MTRYYLNRKPAMKKQNDIINLTESQLTGIVTGIVKESIKKYLNESNPFDVEPVPGFINAGRFNDKQMEEILSMCKKAIEIIRDIAGTAEQNDPYLKEAQKYMKLFAKSVKDEIDYYKNSTQVHYKH